MQTLLMDVKAGQQEMLGKQVKWCGQPNRLGDEDEGSEITERSIIAHAAHFGL